MAITTTSKTYKCANLEAADVREIHETAEHLIDPPPNACAKTTSCKVVTKEDLDFN